MSGSDIEGVRFSRMALPRAVNPLKNVVFKRERSSVYDSSNEAHGKLQASRRAPRRKPRLGAMKMS
jgi:hypothetical protein